MSVYRVIEICHRCKGTGIIRSERCIDHHKGEYTIDACECSNCLGTGKVIVQTVTTVLPYTQEDFDNSNEY